MLRLLIAFGFVVLAQGAHAGFVEEAPPATQVTAAAPAASSGAASTGVERGRLRGSVSVAVPAVQQRPSPADGVGKHSYVIKGDPVRGRHVLTTD